MAHDRLPVFLDTAYVNALVNVRDQWHNAAVQWEERLAVERRRLVTTECVLVEIADGLAAVRFRAQAVQVITTLQASSFVDIIPASSQLFRTALELYRRRADKDWGLTDCVSFVVMSEQSLSEALTTDDHFRQAGFRALLLESPDRGP
ncbi:MAG TPA: PIN domain-containing protein [Candidatus Tectomicrobia bacterium]